MVRFSSLSCPFCPSRYSVSVSLSGTSLDPSLAAGLFQSNSPTLLFLGRWGKGTILYSSMEEGQATFLSFWDRNRWLDDLWGLFLQVHSIFSQGFSVVKSWPYTLHFSDRRVFTAEGPSPLRWTIPPSSMLAQATWTRAKVTENCSYNTQPQPPNCWPTSPNSSLSAETQALPSQKASGISLSSPGRNSSVTLQCPPHLKSRIWWSTLELLQWCLQRWSQCRSPCRRSHPLHPHPHQYCWQPPAGASTRPPPLPLLDWCPLVKIPCISSSGNPSTCWQSCFPWRWRPWWSLPLVRLFTDSLPLCFWIGTCVSVCVHMHNISPNRYELYVCGICAHA